MKKAALSLAILVSFCLVFGVACGGNNQASSGILPVWHIGDTWTGRISCNGTEFTIVNTVTDEQVINGTDCYIILAACTPPFHGVSIATGKVDKATREKIDVRELDIINGVNYSIDTLYNYSGSPYPLSIGKTWTITKNITTTNLMINQSKTTNKTNNYVYRVEKVESVTVPAGTFNCFKAVAYDSNNSIRYIQWFTDVAGVIVKTIDYNDKSIEELMSYSLSK